MVTICSLFSPHGTTAGANLGEQKMPPYCDFHGKPFVHITRNMYTYCGRYTLSDTLGYFFVNQRLVFCISRTFLVLQRAKRSHFEGVERRHTNTHFPG